jgi:hypothetical protein
MKTKNKKNGKYSELQFSALAIKLGFNVLQPIEDSNSYDLVLEKNSIYIRVQIKSTHTVRRRLCGTYKNKKYFSETYNFNTSDKKNLYTKKNVDFIIAHIAPTNEWYILPIEHFKCKSLSFGVNSNKSKYSKYKNNFDLLEKR